MSKRIGAKDSPLQALPWLGMALFLIVGFVLWPTIELFLMSFRRVDISGLLKGWAGLENYRSLFDNSDIKGTITRTAIWLVVVVAFTMAISLPLAQLLNAKFIGQKFLRYSVIVPWAASLVITATSWKWILNGYFGVFNLVLQDLHIIKEPVDLLSNPKTGFMVLLVVGIAVSLPFTTYVLLAGLQSIPHDIMEAARVDGAGAWKGYWTIVFPLLRPAFLVAAVINSVYVFNSFPIIWVMTQGGPGYETDTTTTFAYKVAFRDQDIGQSASLAVGNFIVIFILIMIFLKLSKWRDLDKK
ncbi:MAG: sugar ABC transporter permease [Actinomycetales bacterium]|nr:MAG: sugar ABC transporter permease [Actinomycetales bacterium]